MINNTFKIYTLFAIAILSSCNKSIKEEVSKQQNIINKSISIETNLEELNSVIVNPCKYYKNMLGLLDTVNRNKSKSCSLEYHNIRINVNNDYKNSNFWFIKINMPINKNKEKFIRYTIDGGVVRKIVTFNKCYPISKDTYGRYSSVNCGASKTIEFNNEQEPEIARIECNDNKYDDSLSTKSLKKNSKVYFPLACGQLFLIYPDKILRKENNFVFDNRIKCNNECFDIIPFMKPGDYMIRKSNTILRAKPNRNSEIIATYQVDEKLQLIKDIGNIEEINFWVAPWVKVKMHDGKQGYIFGALLKKEGEFFPY